MRKLLLAGAALAGLFVANSAVAQTRLDAYADAKGYVNVSTLTCDQLANTYQEDADNLAIWLSGWYNGLAKKHYADLPRTTTEEHKLIKYCQAHRNIRILEALDILFKEQRDRLAD